MRLPRLSLVLAVAAACGSNPSSTKRSGPTTRATTAATTTTAVPTTAVPTTAVPTTDTGIAVEVRTAIKPKPLSSRIEKGLAWLAKHQLPNGGWGQGDESRHMGTAMAKQRDRANVADTSMALLAFLRAGYGGRTGEYQAAVQRGVDYVLSEIEASDDTSLKVTSVTGTRVQSKIGQNADTFAALMMLGEAKGRMKDGVANARVDAAIKKVVRKIERNQRDDGSWEGQGWAPVLSQALAAKGLNRVAQNGIQVSRVVLERVEKQARSSYDARAKAFAATGGAGVAIYSAAAATAAQRDSAQTRKVRVQQMKAKAAAAAKAAQSPGVPTKAQIHRAEQEAKMAEDATAGTEAALVARLDDKGFIAGFGNNGGEEFLSYLLISETLVQKGGKEWARWDQAITNLVVGVQNEDGSWTGHHCITGRTFCTAAALLVLMGDRTPATVVIAS